MSFLSVIAPTFFLFAVIRFLYGIGLGIILPLSASFLTEITPGFKRGERIVMSRIFWSIGGLLTCIISWIILEDQTHGSWRLILFIISIPSFLSIWQRYKYNFESPRYLLINGQY